MKQQTSSTEWSVTIFCLRSCFILMPHSLPWRTSTSLWIVIVFHLPLFLLKWINWDCLPAASLLFQRSCSADRLKFMADFIWVIVLNHHQRGKRASKGSVGSWWVKTRSVWRDGPNLSLVPERGQPFIILMGFSWAVRCFRDFLPVFGTGWKACGVGVSHCRVFALSRRRQRRRRWVELASITLRHFTRKRWVFSRASWWNNGVVKVVGVCVCVANFVEWYKRFVLGMVCMGAWKHR